MTTQHGPARGPLPPGPTKKDERAMRMRHEKDYLDAVRKAVSPEDITRIVKQIIADAENPADPRICNAARNWMGIYLLRGGRMLMSDINSPPVIEKR